MAKPNFHDRSWQDIDWETWGSQFSIVDRASSVGELQNGITTRYMEVQDLLSQLPPHAGRAQALVAAWRLEVNGYGRTVVFSESTRLLRRLDDLHAQVTASCMPPARPPRPLARRASAPTPASRPAHRDARAARPRTAAPTTTPTTSKACATARPRRASAATTSTPASRPPPMRWAAVQAAMARECDGCMPDTAKPVTARQFRTAVDAAGDGARRAVPAGARQRHGAHRRRRPHAVLDHGLPNLENLGIARFSIYRRDGQHPAFRLRGGHPQARRRRGAARVRRAGQRPGESPGLRIAGQVHGHRRRALCRGAGAVDDVADRAVAAQRDGENIVQRHPAARQSRIRRSNHHHGRRPRSRAGRGSPAEPMPASIQTPTVVCAPCPLGAGREQPGIAGSAAPLNFFRKGERQRRSRFAARHCRRCGYG